MIFFFEDPSSSSLISQYPFTRYKSPAQRPMGPISLTEVIQDSHKIFPRKIRLGESIKKTLCQSAGNHSTEPIFINAFLIPSKNNIKNLLAQLAELKGKNGWIIKCGDEVIAWKNRKSNSGQSADTPKGGEVIANNEYSLFTDLPQWISVSLSLLQDEIDNHIRIRKLQQSARHQDLWLGQNVKIHPTAVIDTSKGPVAVNDGSQIHAFGVIQGPVVIGQNSIVNPQAWIQNSVIGNTVKVGGEVSSSIISDYSNKAHYGYLGNTFVGEWVNIGAGTITSNLKNNYRQISYHDGWGRKQESGEIFLGSWLGDFSKVGVNTSLSPGTIVGIGASLSGIIEGRVNDFSILNSLSPHFQQEERLFLKLSSFIETHQAMFSRRHFNPDQNFWEEIAVLYQDCLRKSKK